MTYEALERIAAILKLQTDEIASIGRLCESIDANLGMLREEVRTALKRLTEIEGRVAGLELAREADALPENGNGHA